MNILRGDTVLADPPFSQSSARSHITGACEHAPYRLAHFHVWVDYAVAFSICRTAFLIKVVAWLESSSFSKPITAENLASST